MRATVLACLAAAAVGCNAYDPNLPNVPFRCGTTDPVCPGGYECSAGNCVVATDGPDARINTDARCLDLAEPNDTLQMATLTPVWDQLNRIVLESITLCPMTDKDFFRVSQPLNCGAAPPCPNLDALVRYIGPPPKVTIQSATGATVAVGGGTPTPGEIKAVLNNVAQGQYYVVVEVMTVGLDNYQLTIDGTRAL